MKKTLFLISTKAITLNNFFDEFVKNKKFNFILGCSDPKNLKLKKTNIKLFFNLNIVEILNPILFLKKLKQNFSIIKKLNFDYVLINTPLAALYIRPILFLLGKKIIYLVHGFRFHKSEKNFKSFFFFIYEKIFSLITNYYIVLNKEDYEVVFKKFKYKKEKILKIPSIGVNYKKLINLKKKKNKYFNIGVIAAYRDNKGYPDLIKIAERVQKKNLNIKFNCYGYDDKKKYLNKIKKLNLNNIVLNNFDYQIHKRITHFDLVCHFSRREGMPISLLEAITIGIPVIAYNIRGNKDLIKNNINGILVEPFNVDNFEASLNKLYQNPKILERLMNNCKNSIKDFHDKKNVTLMINNFIKKC